MVADAVRRAMDCELLGWPPDGPRLDLDHERFAYAGKFVMTDTGKAVGREDSEAQRAPGDRTESGSAAVVAAASFSPDRTDDDVLRIRYITVRRGGRGEGRGPALADFVAERAFARGYRRVKIAVNNPYAYEAIYRAGFGFTGEETGLAELVLARPADGARERYVEGFERFADRDLDDDARAFVSKRLDDEPSAPGDARREP